MLETRFVRIRRSARDGYVEFDYAIDDPRLSVRLLLPYPDFMEFCNLNNVVFMTPEQSANLDRDRNRSYFDHNENDDIHHASR